MKKFCSRWIDDVRRRDKSEEYGTGRMVYGTRQFAVMVSYENKIFII